MGKTSRTSTRCPGCCGLGNANTSVMSDAGSARARGPEKWSAMKTLLMSGAEIGKPAQRPQTGHEAILTAPVDDEVRQSLQAAADRAMRDGELTSVVHPDQRIPLGGRTDE